MLYLSIISFIVDFSTVVQAVILESERVSVSNVLDKVSLDHLEQGLFVVDVISRSELSKVDEVFTIHSLVPSPAESASTDVKDQAASINFASESRLFAIDRVELHVYVFKAPESVELAFHITTDNTNR